MTRDLILRRNIKHNLTQSKKDQAFQQEMARMRSIGSGIRVRSSTLRINTFMQGLVGGVLLTTALVSLTQAEAKEAKATNAADPDLKNDVAVPVAGSQSVTLSAYPAQMDIGQFSTALPVQPSPTPAETASAPKLAKGHDEKLAPVIGNEEILVLVKKLKIIVSSEAHAHYLRTDRSFQQDEANLRQWTAELMGINPMLKCKLIAILNSSNFHIELIVNDNNVANYDALSSTMFISVTVMHDEDHVKRALIHEAHHGFISVQNNLTINTKAVNPFQGQEHRELFYKKISVGISKLNALLALTKKNYQSLTTQEKSTLKCYQSYIKGYKPYRIASSKEFDEKDIQSFQNNGLLNKDLMFVGTYHYNSESFKEFKADLFGHQVEKKPNGKYKMFLRYVPPGTMALEAAATDVSFVTNILIPRAYQDNRDLEVLELDAHITDRLSPYGRFFQKVFPDLLKYHEDRSHESHKKCMAGQSKQPG